MVLVSGRYMYRTMYTIRSDSEEVFDLHCPAAVKK